MTIILNGDPFEVTSGLTLAGLVAMRQASGHLKTPIFAVERNQQVVPKKDLPTVRLLEHDQINVAVMVGGG